jgi:hypothetical protein
VQDRRGGGPPVIAGLHRLPLPGPRRPAVEVVTEEAHVAEVSVHPLAVGDGGLGGVRVLDVQGVLGDALIGNHVPQDLAAIEVDAVDLPLVHLVGRGIPVAAQIKALLGHLRSPLRYGGGHEDPIAPDNRRRPAPAGDIDHPRDLLRRGAALRARCAPGDRQNLILDDPSLQPPELRPVGLTEGTDIQEQCNKYSNAEIPTHQASPFYIFKSERPPFRHGGVPCDLNRTLPITTVPDL